jgi:peptide/nickel transport system permease protein
MPWRLIAQRLLMAVPVLFGITLFSFFILELLPGSAAERLLGATATLEDVARLTAELKLDRPAWERYTEWLGDLATGDTGRSLASHQPVATLIAERLPVSLQLVGGAFFLTLCVSVPLSLLAAHESGRVFDRIATLASMAAISVPNYVLALALVFVFSVKLAIFPAIGFIALSEGVGGNLVSLALPTAAIAVPLTGFYVRFLRADLLEQMNSEEYILTALAKGLSPGRVLVRHALRNSLLGLLTLVGLHLGTLIGSTVVIEQIFALPGIGQLLLQAINTRDAPTVQGLVLLLATTTITANLIVDIAYMILDPRIRYGGR